MKTAEEWVNKEDTGLSALTFSYEAEHSDEDLINFVKQIQLDAWKQGMTDALAEVEYCNGADRDRIINTRDEKTTLDS